LVLATLLTGSLSLTWAAGPDLLVEYTFKEGEGDTINDVSGVGAPLNLVVEELVLNIEERSQ